MSPQEVASVRRRTPIDPIPVPDQPSPVCSRQDEPHKTGLRIPQKRESYAVDPSGGGLRISCCGLTLACSVYRTLDQLENLK